MSTENSVNGRFNHRGQKVELLLDPVFLVELIMLAALIIVGLYATYIDFRQYLVPNKYTFSLLAIGLIGQLTMVYLDVTTLGRVVMVLLAGLAIALGLTLYGFWAPGDAKLFWAATVALPPSLCPSTEIFSMEMAPQALLLNTLLCYLLVLLFVPLWRERWRRGEGEGRPGGLEWLRAAWGLIGLLGLAQVFVPLLLDRPLSYVEGFVVLIISYKILDKALPTKYWPVILVPGVVVFLYLSTQTTEGTTNVLILGIVWLIEVVYLQVRYWYSRAYVQLFPVRLLQVGAIPHYSLGIRAVEGDEGELAYIEGKEKVQGELICEAGKPLSQQQVRQLRELESQGRLPEGDRFEVEQAIPFAPFVVVGTVLTAVFMGSLILPLTHVINWLVE